MNCREQAMDRVVVPWSLPQMISSITSFAVRNLVTCCHAWTQSRKLAMTSYVEQLAHTHLSSFRISRVAPG
jgi:hypothetical protein